MSLRDLSVRATTTRVFLKQEGVDTILAGDAISADQSSLQLAVQIGLVDQPAQRNSPVRTYRVLGFDPQKLWCDSTKLVALDSSLIRVYPQATNCGGPNEISYIDLARNNPLPFVSLDYFESILGYADSGDGDIVIQDSPTLDARIERIWRDGTQFHATVWIEGSYKGKHESTTVEFTYDPTQDVVCASFDNFRNDFIRVEDIEVCWYLTRNVVCVRATVIWRPSPQIRAHLEVCMGVAAPADQRREYTNKQSQPAQKCVSCENASLGKAEA
jgi:hypothetical protein